MIDGALQDFSDLNSLLGNVIVGQKNLFSFTHGFVSEKLTQDRLS